MNKGLHDQINKYMPVKINAIRESARKRAEKDFNDFSERITTGEFSVVKDDQIEVTALNGELVDNTIWREQYLNTLSKLFSEENLQVLKIYSYSGAIAQCTAVCLKI